MKWWAHLLAGHVVPADDRLRAGARLRRRGGDEGRADLGDFTKFLLFLSLFYEPIDRLNSLNQMILSGRAAADRVFEILDSEEEPNSTRGSRAARRKSRATCVLKMCPFPIRTSRRCTGHARRAARPDHRAGRLDRCGQNHRALPAGAVLRSHFRDDHHRRHPHRHACEILAARPPRLCHPGAVPLQRHRPREPAAREARRHRRRPVDRPRQPPTRSASSASCRSSSTPTSASAA